MVSAVIIIIDLKCGLWMLIILALDAEDLTMKFDAMSSN